MPLSQDEVLRYSRHLILPEVGVEGQEKLKKSSVLLIGMGGLGSPLGLYLAAAGIGKLGLIDFDLVDYSNLQRQVIHTTADVGRPKVESGRDKIQAINPNVQVEIHRERLSAANILEVIKPYDVVIDGTDNFPTRYLVNDACVFQKKPNIYGSIFRFEGQATVFDPTRGPCYRCLYPEPPPPGMVPSCAEGGVLGILPGTIGLIQATETIKLILGVGEPLIGRLLLYNALDAKYREVKIQKDPDCPVCSKNPTITQLIDYEQFCGIKKSEGTGVATGQTRIPEISVQELADLKKGGNGKFVLIDVREPEEFQIAKIEGAKLIPLGQIQSRVNELDSADDIVVHCHYGGRSAKAVEFLRQIGFKKVRNLVGGIDAWSQEIDSKIARY